MKSSAYTSPRKSVLNFAVLGAVFALAACDPAPTPTPPPSTEPAVEAPADTTVAPPHVDGQILPKDLLGDEISWGGTATVSKSRDGMTILDTSEDIYAVATWVFYDYDPLDFVTLNVEIAPSNNAGYSSLRIGYKQPDGTVVKTDIRIEHTSGTAIFIRGEGELTVDNHNEGIRIAAQIPIPQDAIDPYMEIYPAPSDESGVETKQAMGELILRALSIQ